MAVFVAASTIGAANGTLCAGARFVSYTPRIERIDSFKNSVNNPKFKSISVFYPIPYFQGDLCCGPCRTVAGYPRDGTREESHPNTGYRQYSK